MSMLVKLGERLARINARIDAINAAAEAREGDVEFTEAEETELKKLIDEGGKVKAQIETINKRKELEFADWRNRRGLSRPGEFADGAAAEFDDGARIEVEPNAKGPFRTLGEQLKAIVDAGRDGGTVDPRLFRVATSSDATAQLGAGGGFMLQKEFSIDLMKEAFESGALAQRCSVTEIGEGANGLEVTYIDETSRATGSRWGGVQVFRAAEAETVDRKRPKFGKWECRLETMLGLARVPEPLMEDAPALADVFREGFTDEFSFMADDEIYRGTGVGQCLGILNADCLVSVAKETGQEADTIIAENIANIWSRVLPRSQSRGIWVYNTECFPQLQQLSIGVGTSGQLVFMPAGGISGSPFATIYGRPAIPIEQASALGDVGDIAFIDLSQYKLIRKGGVRYDESIHVRFEYDQRSLRWRSRFNGAPKLKSAITPYKGASGRTLSAFVTLAARA